MIGLGVGIDYALFIVTATARDLRAGMTVEEAAGRANATSGAAVLFAGATVVIAICGLAIAGIPAVTVMGLMAALRGRDGGHLPHAAARLLGFAGHRIDAIRVPGAGQASPAASRCGTAGAGRSRPTRGATCSGHLVLGLLAAPASPCAWA